MIPRYSDPKIAEIWDDDRRIALWAKIELAHLQALDENAGRGPLTHAYPADAPDAAAVATREQYTGHEMGAFLELFEDYLLESRHKQYLHYGLTSSNVIDTADAMQMNRTTELLCVTYELDLYGAIHLEKLDVEVQGYTHGQRAEPTNMSRRFQAAYIPVNGFQVPVLPASLGGAVGRGPLAPKIQEAIAHRLGMKLCTDVTQVLPRWRFNQVLWLWTQFVNTCEQIALDVRLMSTLGDANEPARAVGSTAMPGKVNPIRAERICGLAKYVRGQFGTALESQTLWLDRDLSHSSVDRILFPNMAHLVAFILRETVILLEALVVHPLDAEPGKAAQLAQWQETFDEPRSVMYGQIREHYRDSTWGKSDVNHA